MRNDREHQEQVALFRWAACLEAQHPELKLMYAIPNGGARHIAVARKLKAEGVKAGMPDICLPVARQTFHALYIEMKSEKGKLSSLQKEKIGMLQGAGNYACVYWDWISAARVICNYLEIDPISAGVGRMR